MQSIQLNREELEAKAKESVCSCWAYTLAGAMDETPDDELRAIIHNPMAPHYENQKHDPVSVDEFTEELRSCPSYERTPMRAEVAISFEHATTLWGHSDTELLWVDDYGVTSVVEEDGKRLDPSVTYAIDGPVIGAPYGDKE